MEKPTILASCDRQHFTNCDQCILNLVYRYLDPTNQSFTKLEQEKQILQSLKQILAQLSVIIVTLDGQVQFMTQRGRELLSKYVSFDHQKSLPKYLQKWLKNKISLAISNPNVVSSHLSVKIEKKETCLYVRLISSPIIQNQYLLLLEEQQLPSLSIPSLRLLGLTLREAEVLFWVAKDKSNAAIAKLLGCSKETVRKHMEHIHTKLEVQTRMTFMTLIIPRQERDSGI